jgi:hypothetical protein
MTTKEERLRLRLQAVVTNLWHYAHQVPGDPPPPPQAFMSDEEFQQTMESRDQLLRDHQQVLRRQRGVNKGNKIPLESLKAR